MMPKKLFNESDLQALAAIADTCQQRGFDVRFQDTHVLEANGGERSQVVLARIRPARENDGIMVTGIDLAGRRIFDAPATAFQPGGNGLRALTAWLECHLL